MTTSRQTFTQVKDILKKLDRSIEQAREKRLQKETDPRDRNGDGPQRATPAPRPLEEDRGDRDEAGGSNGAAGSPPDRLKATPMRPREGGPEASLRRTAW